LTWASAKQAKRQRQVYRQIIPNIPISIQLFYFVSIVEEVSCHSLIIFSSFNSIRDWHAKVVFMKITTLAFPLYCRTFRNRFSDRRCWKIYHPHFILCDWLPCRE
jgi:hypothetical protein